MFQLFEFPVPRRIFSIPPTVPLFDELKADVGAMPQEHIGNFPPVLVGAVGIEQDFLPDQYVGDNVLRLFPLGLTLFGTVNPVNRYPFRLALVEDIENITV